MSSFNGQKLSTVVNELEKFAPSTYAEKWDNVGLLIDNFEPERAIKKILLTNDLTEPVATEAVEKRVDLIISYHPPIFKPLTRITSNNWKERVVASCLLNSIALYSPHTAWDKVVGGVNDWLARAVGATEAKPIIPEMGAPAGTGSGRYFETNLPIISLVRQLHSFTRHNVHMALAIDHHPKTMVHSVAVCAGSGYSVLCGVRADLIVTGEMSHHEILDFNHNGTTVLLCNHSNSERGFLENFAVILAKSLEMACEVIISEADKDPLETVFLPQQNVKEAPKEAEQ